MRSMYRGDGSLTPIDEEPDGLNTTWSRSERRVPRLIVRPLRAFLDTEASSGIILLVGALTALLWANSTWASSYERFWHTELTLRLGSWAISEDLRHWINDGLMAIFFFVVGLEIKRELVAGELRDRRVAALPVVGAVGGMVVPAAIFLAFNAGGATSGGWGIPMATDIAGGTLGRSLTSRVAIGIVVGLVAGRVVGISSACWFASRAGLARLPEGATWLHLVAVSSVAGIGFTVSLFIASLAFSDPTTLDAARIGVLTASLLAGTLGFLLLSAAGHRRRIGSPDGTVRVDEEG